MNENKKIKYETKAKEICKDFQKNKMPILQILSNIISSSKDGEKLLKKTKQLYDNHQAFCNVLHKTWPWDNSDQAITRYFMMSIIDNSEKLTKYISKAKKKNK